MDLEKELNMRPEVRKPTDTLLSSWYNADLSLFKHLLFALGHDTCQVVVRGQLARSDMLDQIGRLQVWGHQSGAARHPSNRGSLDHILRRETELHDVVRDILELLWDSLERGQSSHTQPRDKVF